MKTSGAHIDAWIGRWGMEYDPELGERCSGYRLSYVIEATTEEPIEQALETLFKEQGLPHSTMKPSQRYRSTERGFEIVEKVTSKYGAQLVVPFKATFGQRNIVRD